MSIPSLSAHALYADPSSYTPYVGKIISRLDAQMAAAQQSIDELHRISASYEVHISDYGAIQSDLSNLAAAAQKLSGADAFSLYRAKSTAPTILTAHAQKNAAPGVYSIEVNQLAQSETLVSGARQDPAARIGSGAPSTVTFQFVNGTSQSITIDQGNNTLPGIAAGINQANVGISASVVFNGSAFQLALQGPSGGSNAFSIAVSGDQAIADLLSYSDGGARNGMTRTMAAQDAQGSVNGTPFTGSGNLIRGSEEGVMFHLSQVGHADVTVDRDMDRIIGSVRSFVDAYNSVLNDLVLFQTEGVPGDPTLQEIGNRFSDGRGLSSGSLEQIGITRSQEGGLTFDAGMFQGAYSRNPEGVAGLFTGNGTGLADLISRQLQDILEPGGSISSAIDRLLSKIQANERKGMRIEEQAFQDLQYSAHEYAQQLAIMIIAQIVGQFMLHASAQPGRSPEEEDGMLFSGRTGTVTSNTISAGRLNPMPVAEFETLTNTLAVQYDQPAKMGGIDRP